MLWISLFLQLVTSTCFSMSSQSMALHMKQDGVLFEGKVVCEDLVEVLLFEVWNEYWSGGVWSHAFRSFRVGRD